MRNANQSAPKVFAVVLNWNGFDDTVACVKSLEQIEYPNLSIVLVDNGSADGSGGRLAKAFPSLSFLQLDRNLGYAAGNNRGIMFALAGGAEYVLVVNNDVIVDPQFLSPMVKIAEENQLVGMVTCKAFLQSERARVYATGGYFSRLYCSVVPLKADKQNTVCEISFISGCILLVRRNVFEKVGLFDEKFFMYYEDLEFSRRVSAQFKLMYTPEGVVYHNSGGGQRWSNYTSTYLYYSARNRFWFFHESTMLYRLYVFLYSLLNAVAKSFTILIGGIWNSPTIDVRKRIIALWKGFFDGLLTKPAPSTN